MSIYPTTFSLCRVLIAFEALLIPLFNVDADWSTPVAISTTVSDQPTIAVDSSGNAVLAWQGYDGSNYVIQSASLPYGGNWSTPVNLSSGGFDAQSPSIGIDYLSNAVVVWSRYNGWNSIVQGATLPLQGSWTSSVNISESGQNATSPKVSLNPAGTVSNAVAVWQRYNGSNFIMQASNLPNMGVWTTPTSISVSGQDALVPTVAVDLEGNAAAVCSRYDGSNFTSRAASYFSNQTWSSSFTLSTPGATASQQSLGMDSNGNSVIVWSYFNGSNSIIQSSNLHFGDGWSSATDISTLTEDSYIPQIAVDSTGRATVVWTGFNGTNFVAQAASADASGVWGSPIVISANGADVNNISIAVDPSGNVTALWDYNDGVNSSIQSATLPLGGSWSTPVTVSSVGDYAYLPVVALDGSGRAVAAWLETSGGNTFVYGATMVP